MASTRAGGEAVHRKTAVELIQQLQAVEAALRHGRLCLSSVCELAKVVTAENVGAVLPRFFGLSRREAEAVAASIRPAAVVPQRELVTPILPAARATVVAPSCAASREISPVEQTSSEVHPGEPASRMDLVVAPPPPPHPKALGGPATVESTRAACRGHNQLAARQVFGDAFIDRFARTARKRAGAQTLQSSAARIRDMGRRRGEPGG